MQDGEQRRTAVNRFCDDSDDDGGDRSDDGDGDDHDDDGDGDIDGGDSHDKHDDDGDLPTSTGPYKETNKCSLLTLNIETNRRKTKGNTRKQQQQFY